MNCAPVPTATATTEAEVCANCGKEGSDTIKLKNCTACFLVKYCGVDCQKIHRKHHKKACKERAAELKYEKLYSQGHERAEADFCPICLLAIPTPIEEYSTTRPCCMKTVCDGCCHAATKGGFGVSCPFCRAPPPESQGEAFGMIQKRVAAKDPEAIVELGEMHNSGLCGMEKDVPRAIELWTEAAELGSTTALFKMGSAYYSGEGVARDETKGIGHWESAAMQGHAASRAKLGCVELQNGNCDRAVRHLMISAKMGHKKSLDVFKGMFTDGLGTKAQYAEALKGYQDAVEETKSPEREEAANIGFSSTSNLVY